MIDAAILAAADRRIARALSVAPPPCALVVDGERLGLLDPARLQRLAAFTAVFERHGDDVAFHRSLVTPAQRSDAMAQVVRTLAGEGLLSAWRNECYAVSSSLATEPAFLVERAAARYLGIRTWAAHANGLVRRADGRLAMWLARRSPAKAIDPGMLDNLVGGGMAAGETAARTLVREAWEEAGVDASEAQRAAQVAVLDIERHVPEGYQRETIFAYDLWLPAQWQPANQDGEAVEHRCVDLDAVARLLALEHGDDMLTLDATIVALDCVRRHASASV